MKNDNANNNDKKIYNPKSHAPSVYIPCWLIQVSTKLLSTNAKMLYGRLAQWSTEEGDVFRSSMQLSEELGTPSRTIERHLKELRDVKLINTLQPQAGGLNHFEFLYHEWMDLPINKHLAYKMPPPAKNDPPPKMAGPPAKNGGTPPPKMADINKKEIKINTTTTNAQNLNIDRDPEPVVVIDTSLTSTPKVNPLTPVNREVRHTDDVLLTAYRAKPFFSINILTEHDFLSACDYLIKDRGDIPLRGRIKGIVGLIHSGNFDEPPEWAKEQQRMKNREKGDAQTKLNEELALKRAPILTKAKTKQECMAEMMEKALKVKKETTIEPIYKESTLKKNSELLKKQNKKYKKIELPQEDKNELMFQPDLSLLISEEEE